MKGFRINGSFKDVRHEQVFSIEIAAADKDAANECALSTLGSRHKLKRWEITINEIVELANDDIADPLVKYQVGEN